MSYRLEKVVESMYFERADRVVAVGGRKNHDRPVFSAQGIEHAKAIEAGHLDVQENDVGIEFLNLIDGGRSVHSFPDHFDALSKCREQARQTPACFGLIVHDQSAPCHA